MKEVMYVFVCVCVLRELARLTTEREEVRVDIGLGQLHLQRRMRQLQAAATQAAKLCGQKDNVEQVSY